MTQRQYARMHADVEDALDIIEAEREGVEFSDSADYPVTLRSDNNYVIGMVSG